MKRWWLRLRARVARTIAPSDPWPLRRRPAPLLAWCPSCRSQRVSMKHPGGITTWCPKCDGTASDLHPDD